MTSEFAAPRIIWTLWLQGWADAPDVVRASVNSWRAQNPGWQVRALDEASLPDVLPPDALARARRARHSPAAYSDCIRLELLHRYGGVWADATTLCMAPLDTWLPGAMPSGFFAFDKPAEDRPIASWFLAAERGSYIIDRWRKAAIEYWAGNPDPNVYFWIHNLFGERLANDAHFAQLWAQTPKRSANHEGHLHPDDARFKHAATPAQLQLLHAPPQPVFKLTIKGIDDRADGSILDVLAAHGLAMNPAAPPLKKRLLIAWYGSFAGHGTIGDLRSLESVVTHFVGRGHDVAHATADAFAIPGAARIDWRTSDPAAYDAVIFVCGPILETHPETRALFQHFEASQLAGIGVSIMPTGHFNHFNPFDALFARQGGATDFGDVAIVAPEPYFQPLPIRGNVGVSLRGAQGEYGEDVCLWRETDDMALNAAASAAPEGGGSVVTIENHLARSGGSAEDIEHLYAHCDLIITSRFHGAVEALRFGKPFIAIDQIKGGAKVFDLLAPLGWPHIYRADSVSADAIEGAAKALITAPDHPKLLEARDTAAHEANITLAALTAWAESLTPASRG